MSALIHAAAFDPRDDAIRSHLEACTTCGTLLRDARRHARLLAQSEHIADCDEAEVFLCAIDGGLRDACTLAPLIAHLQRCSACRLRILPSLLLNSATGSVGPGRSSSSVTPIPTPLLDFEGTERFQIRRRLGRGGMGVVYEALDRKLGVTVALKTLRNLDAQALYRLKNEFRARQDLQHPNLISPGELFHDEGQWFFTMELVLGVDFLRYVRRGSAEDDAWSSTDTSTTASRNERTTVVAPVPTRVLEAMRAADAADRARAGGPALEATEVIKSKDKNRFIQARGAISARERATERAIERATDRPTADDIRRTDVDLPSAPGSSAPGSNAPGSIEADTTVDAAHDDDDDAPRLCDVARLRAALYQLALGLTALHDAGKVHRDIKPSNIMITETGRLVLLDFGLITDAVGSESTHRFAVGTPAYMAPEQASGYHVGPPADWYSVGVLMYQALTGQLPFSEPRLDAVVRRHTPPPPVQSVVPEAPPELAELCMELLATDPDARPTGRDVLSRLGEPAAAIPLTPASIPASYAPLFGRDDEMDTLRGALAHTRQHGAVAVLVDGEPGIGKSALVKQFGHWLRFADGRAVRLSGRCYERESVPYKAFDGVVDALGRHLSRQPPSEVAAVLPRRVHLLGEVFPVLRRIPGIAVAPATPADPETTAKRRALVCTALRELLARIADRRPLALIIDDLQWADADSLELLVELLRPPDPPALLLVATLRDADAPEVARLVDAMPGDVRRLPLGRLPEAAARSLAEDLLSRAALGPQSDAAAIAAEAEGHPLFIHDLVRWVARGPTAGPPRLDESVWGRLAELPPAARRVLDLAAVAEAPISPEVLRRAADVDADEFSRQIGLLRGERLLDSVGVESERLAVYHPRVWAAVRVHLLSAARAGCHRRLAQVLDGDAAPELLARHWSGAGDATRAAAHAERAADAALAERDFERAARMYELALVGADGDAAPRLHAGHGEALAGLGRGLEAAAAFRAAARAASPERASAHRRRAAECLLRGGRVDEGLAALGDLLAAAGVGMPTTAHRARRDLRAHRGSLRRRRLRLARHASGDAGAATQLDLCWAAGFAFGFVDTLRGLAVQARHIDLALRAGDPARVVRALALEAVQRATWGKGSRDRALEPLALASSLAEPLGGDAESIAIGARGVVAFIFGRWRSAREDLERALSAEPAGDDGFARGAATLFSLWSLWHLGELGVLAERARALAQEADDRGDDHAWAALHTGLLNLRWLIADDADGAQAARTEALARLPPREGFHAQHKDDLLAAQNIDLYLRRGVSCWDRISAIWPILEQSHLLSLRRTRIQCLDVRGRSALAAVADGADRGLLGIARKAARQLDREASSGSGASVTAQAAALRAGVALLSGDRGRAAALLDDARRGFDGADMGVCAAAAGRARGRLLGGDEGRALVAEADAEMTARGIAAPERMTAMLIPSLDAV